MRWWVQDSKGGIRSRVVQHMQMQMHSLSLFMCLNPSRGNARTSCLTVQGCKESPCWYTLAMNGLEGWGLGASRAAPGEAGAAHGVPSRPLHAGRQ